MSKKLSYLKCKILRGITFGKTRQHYKDKQKRLKEQLWQADYGALMYALQQVQDYQAYQKFHLLFKQRFDIDIPADVCGYGNFFELIRLPLKDLRRRFPDGSVRSLTETPHYQYLKTRDPATYQKHIQIIKDRGRMSEQAETWSLERFQKLIDKINKEGYIPQKSVIVIGQDNVIHDGVHRSSILLYKYGGDYEISVVQVSRR